MSVTLLGALVAPLALLGQAVSTPTAASTEDTPVVISPFVVTSERDNGYQAANTLAATRTNTAIRDLPMTINVVTEELMNDRALFDLDQVIDSLPGTARVFNEFVPTANIRGFDSTAAMRNGVRGLTTPDMSSVARVEVVKGPAALIYGQTQPGGVINYITKDPSPRRSNSLRVSAGSNDLFRAEIDSTGPLNSAKTLNYRLGATYYHTDNGERQRTLNRYAIAPMLQWQPTAGTNIIARYSYTRDWIRPAEGLAQKPGNAVNRGGDPSRYPDQLGLDPVNNPIWVTDVPSDFSKDSPSSFREYKPQVFELSATQRINRHMDLRLNLAYHLRDRQSVREGGTALVNPWTTTNFPKVGGLGNGLNGWNLDGTPGDAFPQGQHVYGFYGRNGVPSTGIDPLSDTRLIDGVPFSSVVGDTTLAYIPGVSGWRNIQWNGENRRETRANGQVDLVSRFKLGPFQNTVLTGFERNEERVRSNGSGLRYNSSLAQNATYTIPGSSIQVPNYVSYWYNIYSAESTAARDAFAARNVRSLNQFTAGGSINDASTESSSFYGNWAASFNEVRGRIAVGGRYDSFSAETLTRSAGTDPYALDGTVIGTSTGSRNRVTPQAGLSYRVTDAVTIYSLYSESVDPRIRFQPARTAARENTLNLAYANMGLPAPDLDSKPWSELLEPEYGTSFEVGVKTDLFENKVSGSVALFTIDRKNISQTVGAANPDRSVSFLEQVGAMRARGVDVDFYIRPTTGFQIGGGFLYNDTEILEAPLVIQNAAYATGFTDNNGPRNIEYNPVGKPLANAAKWSGNGFVRYDWSSGALQGFGAGLYFTYLGPRADSNTAATRNEDWSRFDLNLSYRTKIREHRVSYAIVVKNLADKFYRVDRDTFAQGRSFLFSASFEY